MGVRGSGNRRDKQLVKFDSEIERTLTKIRQRVKLQRALQGNPFVGNSSEDFTEVFQDNMADKEHNNQRRTLREYITPSIVSCSSSIVRPTVEANNFELKPALTSSYSKSNSMAILLKILTSTLLTFFISATP
ncbi:hypothetical protein PIB30_077482 [Stylosanthes scabra]|uniref:Uncharacterized protein n=1 Tax=Stylosanthes scabra TaxID=79078 RepID=A0ABU6SQN4_9FABA|nr:hypothetical protein [Stylosanthes scabra]